MARADKTAAVAEIVEQFNGSTATVITEYRGLTVANLAELRRSLSGAATYAVAKNTLVKLAAAEAGVEGLDELFAGPTAIAFVQGEPVDAAVVQANHAEYRDLAPEQLPGIRTFIDGRRVSSASQWPGVTYRVIGTPATA